LREAKAVNPLEAAKGCEIIRSARWQRKWHTARTLTAGDWWLLIRAWWLLLAADLALRWFSFQKVQRLFIAMPAATPSAKFSKAQRIVRRVDIAARHHLYSMTCLRRALVAQRLLAECGLATELRIGVRKTGPQLEAHAWVEFEGVPIGEMQTRLAPFTPLSI
jgi:hypothetical protein